MSADLKIGNMHRFHIGLQDSSNFLEAREILGLRDQLHISDFGGENVCFIDARGFATIVGVKVEVLEKEFEATFPEDRMGFIRLPKEKHQTIFNYRYATYELRGETQTMILRPTRHPSGFKNPEEAEQILRKIEIIHHGPPEAK